MGTTSRLSVSLNEQELTLLKQVAPARKLGRFIKEAALIRAREIQRERLRAEIVSAYEGDPEFVHAAGQEWDAIVCEGWPPNV